jgi:hypothetical protein
LLANGYEVLPICGKACYVKGWTKAVITDEWLTEAEADPKYTSTGIRTGRVVGVDLDIEDKQHCEEVATLVYSDLGARSMARVGKKGELLVYRNDEPIAKITIKGKPPAKPVDGDDKEHTLVEILGTGQQFVAHGVHPKSGIPYAWPLAFEGDEPLHTCVDELQAVTGDQLRACAQHMATKLTELGYRDVRVTDRVKRESDLTAVRKLGEPVEWSWIERALSVLARDFYS